MKLGKSKWFVLSFLLIFFLLTPYSFSFSSAKKRIVAFDKHHCESPYYSMWDYIKGKGWKILSIDVEPLTSHYLKRLNVSILWIQRNSLPYTEEEIQEIRKFVYDGGGLLIGIDAPECYWYSKEVLRVFGIKLSGYKLPWLKDITITVKGFHPLLRGVETLYVRSESCAFVQCITVENPAYVILKAGITQPYRPIIAAAEFGKGRVVAYPVNFDEHIFKADNSTFLRNALYWLQQEELPSY